MSVVFLGYHEMGCMALRTLLAREVEVSAVFTYADDPDENCWFGSVGDVAREAGIPTQITEKINTPEWVAYLSDLAPDLILSVYYRHIVGKKIRAIPRYGALNLHGSLLPKYRGRSPVNWQVVNGERTCGLTLHHMVASADAGDIVDREAVELGADETAFDLYQKLLQAGERLLVRQLGALLEGSAPRTPQDHDQATVFDGRGPEDGRIDWGCPARRIHDLVRAVTHPWPGAFTDGPSGRIMVWKTRVLEDGAGLPTAVPGTVHVSEGRTYARARDGWLELLDCERSDGAGLASGDRLTSGETRAPALATEGNAA